jgi:hypothetical protein
MNECRKKSAEMVRSDATSSFRARMTFDARAPFGASAGDNRLSQIHLFQGLKSIDFN